MTKIPTFSMRTDFLIIFTTWLTTRIYIYYYNWPYFQQEDTGTFTMWYLPPDIIREHFAESLLYLRGEPPLPQLFLGTLMKIVGWPFELPIDSILLSLATLAVAFLIQSTMLRFGFQKILATALATAWCIYPANLGVEIAAFPTAFYEALPGFFFMLALWLCLRCFDGKNRVRWLWLFCLAGAMLSMSRSTLSWIFLLPIFIAPFLPSTRRKALAVCLALIVQLAWSSKNYVVYGQFHLETASDVGQNIFSTIINTGKFDDFYAFSVSRNPDDTFIAEGIPCLYKGDLPCVENHISTQTKERDLALKNQLVTNDRLYGETYIMHELSAKIKPLYMDYLLHNPAAAFDMIFRSYQLFWGNIYWQVSYIPGLDTDPLILETNALMEKYKWLNIVAIHALGSMALCLIITTLMRRQPLTSLQTSFLYAALAFGYVAVVSSLGDHGENARYRIDVEPLVWLLPFMSYRCITQFFSLQKNHG